MGVITNGDRGGENPDETVHPLDRLIRELQGLRKGLGLTRGKVEKCELLMETLRVRRPSDWWNFLLDTVNDLGPADELAALRNAYAIDVDPPGNLTRRRDDFALQVRRHSDTVEMRENSAIRTLASTLLLADADMRGSVHVWVRVEHERIRSYRVFEVPENVDPVAAITGASPPDNQVAVAMDFAGDLPTPQHFHFLTPSSTNLTVLQLSVWFRTGLKPAHIWCTLGHGFGDLVSNRFGRYDLQWMATDDRRATITFGDPPPDTHFEVLWRFSQAGPTLEQVAGTHREEIIRIQPPE